MGISSAVNFFIYGLNDQQTPHLRESFAKDQVLAQSADGKTAYEGASSSISDETNKYTTIDTVVNVKTVSDRVRNEQKKFWQQKKNQSLFGFSVTSIGGVATAVAAIVASTVFPPILGVVILISVVSLSLFGSSFFILHRYQQARDQYQQWKDPLPKLIEERKRAGVKGFQYAYSQQLKGKLVTKEEVQDLWYKEMEKTKLNFLTQVPGLEGVCEERVKEFFRSGILSREKIAYAFPDGIPEVVNNLSKTFQELNSQFRQLNTLKNKKIDAIKESRRKQLCANDTQRDLLLRPWLLWFNENHYQPARQNRRVVVVQRPQRGGIRTIPGDRVVCERGQNRNARVERVFKTMTAPIYAEHERNKQKINQWADREIKQAQKNNDQQISYFFDPIKELLSHDHGVSSEETPQWFPMQFYSAANDEQGWVPGFRLYPNLDTFEVPPPPPASAPFLEEIWDSTDDSQNFPSAPPLEELDDSDWADAISGEEWASINRV